MSTGRRKTPWTIKRLEAAMQACRALLAGEEGEGDAEGLAADDLEAAYQRLREERDVLLARRAKQTQGGAS